MKPLMRRNYSFPQAASFTKDRISAAMDPSIWCHESGSVRLTSSCDYAIISIENPPVNSLNHDVRTGLIEALSLASMNSKVALVILTGSLGTFSAGVDLKEFDKPLTYPTLPDVIHAIERYPKPVIAAIEGMALGGGYELALGCDGRIAHPDAQIGLPEGIFGIIPGAGGIVRSLRLASAHNVLDLISSCKPIDATKAKEMGLLDYVSSDVIEEAIRFAHLLHGSKRPLSAMPCRAYSSHDLHDAIDRARKSGKGRPLADIQIEVVKRGLSLRFQDAVQAEREIFIKLRESLESVALRHIFFAERSTRKLPWASANKPKEIQTIGVVGAGTMGAGIAATFLSAGFPVALLDTNRTVLETAKSRITDYLRQKSYIHALTLTSDYATLSDTDLIVEAAFEDLSVKKEIFQSLDKFARKDAILSTNTSYLDINLFAHETKHPERIVGLHFFAPAHIMKLLEIVRTADTSPETLQTALNIGHALKKICVIAEVCEGFIGNRIYNAYRRECEALLQDGATPWQVDRALVEFGFSMGPFSVSDLSGLDIAWANRKRKKFDSPENKDLPVLEWLVAEGRLGRKTKAGWYDYRADQQQPDTYVETLIERARDLFGVQPRTIATAEIQNRACGAIINEALLVLEDKIALRASDIDLVFIYGYGFPKHLGGPLFWISQKSRHERETLLASVRTRSRYGDLDLLI